MRGRVMALYMMVFMGGTPIGSPFIGWVGEQFGARWTLIGGGLLTILGVRWSAAALPQAPRPGASGSRGPDAAVRRHQRRFDPAGRPSSLDPRVWAHQTVPMLGIDRGVPCRARDLVRTDSQQCTRNNARHHRARQVAGP